MSGIRRAIGTAAVIGLSLAAARAQEEHIVVGESGLTLTIPDGGQATGRQVSTNITTPLNEILSLTVSLQLTGTGAGAFNGDFYAYLSHGDELAVLLNRPGRDALVGEDSIGYTDNGMDVTFDDAAPNGDIHVYLTVEAPQSPLPLTGTWEPDGRNINPELVVTTIPRTALLDVFSGTDPNGIWTLFVSDYGAGGTGLLESWSIDILAVPEPSAPLLLAVGAAALWRHRRSAR